MAAGPGRLGLGLRFIRIVQRLRVDRVAEGADREPQQIRRAAPAEDLQRDGGLFDQDADARGARGDEDDGREGADQNDGGDALAADALLDEEYVLRPDCDDQRIPEHNAR